MAYAPAAKNLMLNALAAVAVRVSAHFDDPGDTGLNELSGGSPAYARVTVAWSGASAGQMLASNQPVLDIPGGATVSWIGVWNAAGTVFYGAADADDEIYSSQGTYTVLSFLAHMNG